jgi:UDP:flavonoid glycosyltransferase YjiC (YdhE family)
VAGKVLLAWELGSNLGHISRLLPLAKRLRARGHSVLAVVRDLTLAARYLGPAGIPFIQAPRASLIPKEPEQQASYADMLWQTGWADATQLWAMVQAWVNILRLFGPDVAIVDHSPTALLAARCAQVRCAVIGTGFELPPLQRPLPIYPGFAGATLENAAKTESDVLEHANLCLSAVRVPRLRSLCDLFEADRRWLTTFAELDHYGARDGELYVGPIGEVPHSEKIQWPAGRGHRVFAYLRPDMPNLAAVLAALAASGASTVCYGPGVPPEQTETLPKDRFIVTTRPVELAPLLRDASLGVSYAPAATVTETLLQGVPQLLAPPHAEAQMTAQRVESMGAGMVLRGEVSENHVSVALQTLLNNPRFKARAAAFAEHHRGFDPGHVADNIANEIESLITSQKQGASRDTTRAHG